MADNNDANQEQRKNGGGDENDAWGSFDSSPIANYARMPVERSAAFYNMNHKNRGMALIFNHENFDIPNLKSRTGTHVDCDNLVKVLKQFGFKVSVWHDLKLEMLNKYIEETSRLNHDDNDCLFVAVLTHGELGMLYARDTHYKPDNLWYHFTGDKCKTLAGKPKMFFIQACQGDKLDSGITLVNRTETDGSSTSYRIPIHADFLIVYSTVPGYYSWRNTTRGSWFMQALCEELKIYGNQRDILTLLTFVCQKVAFDFESNTPDTMMMHRQKQVPCITSMLTRLLVLKRDLKPNHPKLPKLHPPQPEPVDNESEIFHYLDDGNKSGLCTQQPGSWCRLL